jgi:uncharacterized membrane protein YccC
MIGVRRAARGIMDAVAKARTWLAAHRAELRQCVRMTAAGLLAMTLGELLGMSRSYWAVLTAVIVTQASVGGSIKAMTDRLIGTLSGAFYGGLVALTIPHASLMGGLAAVGVAVAPLALMSALNPSFRIAPVTAIILLLTPSGLKTGVLSSGIDRVVEITFGSIVGLVCALTVLPARAGALVTDSAAGLTGLFADLLRAHLSPPGQTEIRAQIEGLQDRIRGSIARLETVVGEARHERRTYLASPLDPGPLLRNLLRLRHDLVMLGRATHVPLPPGEVTGRLQPQLDEIAEAAAAFLRGAGEALKDSGPAPSATPAHAALAGFEESVEALRAEGVTRALSSDELERLFTLGFALDQLGRDLDDLAARAAERAR